MRLKNKKTGEIKEVIVGGYPVSGKTKMWECAEVDANEEDGYKSLGTYTSLAELTEEWEDYEEPKVGYIIDPMEEDYVSADASGYEESDVERAKELGIWFETKEEAEQAVEKLKALTEAKEDGLKIKGYYYNHEDLVILADIGKCNKLTLDTLFGKEID